MQLTTYTDYALRVLIYLAVYDDRLVTIADITNAYGISKNHLMKIVHHLAQRGGSRPRGGAVGGCGWLIRQPTFRLARSCAKLNRIFIWWNVSIRPPMAVRLHQRVASRRFYMKRRRRFSRSCMAIHWRRSLRRNRHWRSYSFLHREAVGGREHALPTLTVGPMMITSEGCPYDRVPYSIPGHTTLAVQQRASPKGVMEASELPRRCAQAAPMPMRLLRMMRGTPSPAVKMFRPARQGERHRLVTHEQRRRAPCHTRRI